MKTLIVTGAAGFIGANFVRLATERGYRVIGFDALTYAGHRENIENIKNFELVVGDICHPEVVKSLFQKFQPDALLNFAAESHVDRSIENPLVFVETNVLGTANLLNQSLAYWKTKKDFRYVQISTDEVYGSLGETGKFSEYTSITPSSPYSAAKAGGDHLVNAWHHTFGLPTVTTRCSNNYGPFQFPEKLIPHMIHCALSGKPLPVYGNGQNVRDWIHVSDHCQGILLAYEKGKSGGVYCFGGNAEKKNIDLVHTLCASLDKKRPKAKSYSEQITFVADRLGHDLRYAIDDSLAKKELGFSQKFNFETGLNSTIDWYLENESWRNKVLGGAQ